MKKINKMIAVSIVVIMSFSLLNSCLSSFYENFDNEPLKKLYLDGGTLDGYTPDMTINEVSRLTPTKEGYLFIGWAPNDYGANISKPGECEFSWTQIENSELYAYWIKIPTEQIYERADEVLVTDNGVSKQHYDHISLKSEGTPKYLEMVGYKTLNLLITIDVYSETTGNLYINFYRNSECDSHYDFLPPDVRFQDDSYISRYQIDNEYGWRTVTIEQSFPLSTLKSGSSVYLRYEAISGFLEEHKWLNKNLSVKVWVE